MAHIFTFENVISDDLCNDIVEYMDENQMQMITRNDYGDGQNVLCRKIELSGLKDVKSRELDNRIASSVSVIVRNLCKDDCNKFLHENNPLADAGYELRQILGPTRNHVDNLGPRIEVERDNIYIRYRVASLIMCVSDCEDVLTFPIQNKCIPFKRGMAVVFPPYWTHPHSTEFSGTCSYRIQTWLTTRKLAEN